MQLNWENDALTADVTNARINGDGGAGMGESTGSNPFKGGDFVGQQWQPQKYPGAMQQQSEKQRP